MDFKIYLETNARKIDEEVDRLLIEFLEEVRNTNSHLVPFALGLINSCKGGKRVRGVLVKLGYELANEMSNKEILTISAAFEILHAAILVHDDIMDQSELRRGKPTLYRALGGHHYGISQALTLGDIGLFLAVKLITDTTFPGEYKLKALSYFSQMVINTGWGQVLDVELTQLKHTSEESEPTSEVIKFINLYKTAKYTIAGPLQIGAILGGVDEGLLEKLGHFGENLGIAFQIQDNILDGEAGTVDSAKEKALEYALRAKKVIPRLTKDERLSKLLEQMAEYMVERSK